MQIHTRKCPLFPGSIINSAELISSHLVLMGLTHNVCVWGGGGGWLGWSGGVKMLCFSYHRGVQSTLEDVQSARTITLAFILFELFPLESH